MSAVAAASFYVVYCCVYIRALLGKAFEYPLGSMIGIFSLVGFIYTVHGFHRIVVAKEKNDEA